MPAPEQIKRFVQKTLGCGCPEEVFQSIECREKVRLNSEIVLSSSITIGNRLLIYIMDVKSTDVIEKFLPPLISAGKSERASKGLNRFRLVIAAEEPDEVRRIAEKMFDELRGKDDKIHLHVIDKRNSI